MNIYELEKQATPGPFGFLYKSAVESRAEAQAEGYNTDGGGSMGHVYGRHVLAHMSINRDPKQDARHYADVALLAHCRNNFMRALDGLKKAYVHAAWGEKHQHVGDEIHALIAELEEMDIRRYAAG